MKHTNTTKPIVTVPNIILTTPTKPVVNVDKRVKQMITDMKTALKTADNPKGVGLASTQIGLSVRIFILWPDEDLPMRTIINPEIVAKSEEMVEGIPGSESRMEGCLSIPHVWGMVRRHKYITLKFSDENGKEQTEKFTGFPSIVIQHEVDHLNGVLFTMRVLEQKGTLYEPIYDKEGHEKLEPIQL